MLEKGDIVKSVKWDTEEADEKREGFTCERLEISFAENGVTLTEFLKPIEEPKKGKDGLALTSPYHEPDKYVYEDADAALAHVKAELDAHFGGK